GAAVHPQAFPPRGGGPVRRPRRGSAYDVPDICALGGMIPLILRVFRVLLVACVLLSACSSGGDDAATDTTADEPSTPSAPVASAPPTTAGAEVSGEPVMT